MNTHRASHPIFDIESQIVKAGNLPSPVDLIPWQERIDKIAGKTVEGFSILRIVWGQDMEHAGMWLMGRRRLQFPFWRYEEAGEIHDIGNPRFYLLQLHSRAELMKNNAWENARYHRSEATGFALEDILGPLPDDGFYSHVFCIAYHDELCCNGQEIVNYEPCLGAYRPPTDTDLQRIRRMIWNRDHAANDQLAPSDEQIEKRTDEFTAWREEQWRKPMREMIDDWFQTHRHRFTTFDPSVLSNGKFHFTAGHSRSGASILQINQWQKERSANVSSDASAD